MKALRSALTLVGMGLAVGVWCSAQAEPSGPGPGGGPSPSPGGGPSAPAPGGGPASPGPGGGGGPGSPGTPSADQFQFKVCNRSKTALSVAMLFKSGENTWRSVGWINYKPGSCAPVRGFFPRADFYWYAEDGPGKITYSGKDAYACVHPTNGFDHTITGEYQCAAGEKIVGFTKIDETSIRDGITLTD